MRSKYQAQMVIQLNVRMYAIRNKVMVQHEPSCSGAIMLDIDGANIVRTRTGISLAHEVSTRDGEAEIRTHSAQTLGSMGKFSLNA